MMRKSKWSISLTMILALVMLFGSSLYAFNDLSEGEARSKIMSLKEREIVQGDGTSFFGERALTNSEGVQMIVNGLDLSLAAFLFMKAPLASDSFDQVPNDAWYSDAFVIAAVNGLELPRDIDPNASMTKEEFIHHLFTGLMLKGNYPFTKMLYSIDDEAEVNPDYMPSIQLMLNGKIVKLLPDGKLLPKETVTRAEAAIMLYDTIEFMKAHADASMPLPDLPENSIVEETVTFTLEKATESINKLIVSWGEQPNAGYQINISKIVFLADQTAEVYYTLEYPKEDIMHAQVITTPTAETFLAAEYTPVLMRDLSPDFHSRLQQ